MSKVQVSIIGVTGYTGLELIRLIKAHPVLEIKYLISHSHSGEKISDLYPHLQSICELECSSKNLAQVAKESDFVFLALPHGESKKFAKELIGKTKIIDLAADFRLNENFTYGLSEISRAAITKAQNLANPGCFATAIQLALAPVKEELKSVDILAITGSSGSGKSPSEKTHHPLRAHNLCSYKIGEHQHLAEISKHLNLKKEQINFVPSSGPFVRGIHLSAFIDMPKISLKNLEEKFQNFYQDSPFIRLKKKVELAEIIGSNFADISIHQLNEKVLVQVVIDNLVKGASGQAIQNLNLMAGLDEKTGLYNLSPLVI